MTDMTEPLFEVLESGEKVASGTALVSNGAVNLDLCPEPLLQLWLPVEKIMQGADMRGCYLHPSASAYLIGVRRGSVRALNDRARKMLRGLR